MMPATSRLHLEMHDDNPKVSPHVLESQLGAISRKKSVFGLTDFFHAFSVTQKTKIWANLM